MADRRLSLVWLACLVSYRPLCAQERLQTDWGEFRFSRTSGYTSGPVAGRADTVFKSLTSLLAEYGIKVNADPATLEMNVKRYKLTGRLKKKERMSSYFDCGAGLTGLNADNYHVFVSLIGSVKPLEQNRASLEMSVDGEAVDIPGGRTDRIHCGSTGQLEYTLIERMRALFPGTR